ncbi:MAG: HNH endonuclease [Acidobacteria bacterium]|jgi:putative restriction endonuclease|nr:HNH endonuclease [Acidobacteriota bacterium]OQB58537.1 MAG: hypothetical protein BWX98_00638 [Candidatus Aminicenantes bacterium ADurb.Bin147]HPH43028.1 HNH endonuclease [Candidatus Aminicenantes bacterium]HQH46879.1 HNH endonuclease [Candidatus Aminicenantes bacterium]
MIYREIDLDRKVRQAASAFLIEQLRHYGRAIPRNVLAKGFNFEGVRVPLVGPQGIFKPKILPEIPISILTVPEIPGKPRPYDDRSTETGIILYRYRGHNPSHPDNAGLRKAMNRGIPLIYFYGVEPGWYEPIWPVFIVGDDPEKLFFSVIADDQKAIVKERSNPPSVEDFHRRYITVEIQRRIHQNAFRARVLRAYQYSCAICRLRHHELLEAAHILEDKHPSGIPAVNNGLAMCAIHHKAFDSDILGIRPDYYVEIRDDVLQEKDGPMLLHGLQGFQGKILNLPRRMEERPDRERLEERYQRFRSAG